MKIMISPAKKMKEDTDSFEVLGMPEYLADARILMQHIKKLTFQEAKALWKCSDKLAELNYNRYVHMDLDQALTPAVMAYEGLQYQHMRPGVFSSQALLYLTEHLRILSGFYGLLKPFDGVTPYRLEMQAGFSVNGHEDLYSFWGKRLYHGMLDESRVIINLASREYSRCIEKYITPDDRFITVEFVERIDGKLRQKGTIAKMARGGMVRFLAENQICEPEGMQEFREMGFSYAGNLSGTDRYVFIKD